MKVNMHHQMSKMRAVSSLARAAIHTPKQTSQLARTARQNSCSGSRVIFVCTRVHIKLRTDSSFSQAKIPERITIPANSALPSKLPTHVQSQLAPRSRQEALPVS